MTDSNSRPEPIADASIWVWLWLPLPVVISAELAGLYARQWHTKDTPEWEASMAWYQTWFVGEISIIELGTALVLLCACIMAVRCLVHPANRAPRQLFPWLVIMSLGSVYFFGEEISWGQHLVGWSTPEWYTDATGNRQDETNLHNISSWFNQKPRHLFQAWVLIGGVIVPLYARLRGTPISHPDRIMYWFWPTSVATFIAALAILVRVPEWVADGLQKAGRDPLYDWLTAAPPAELQEFCLGVFLLVYFCSIHRRLQTR